MHLKGSLYLISRSLKRFFVVKNIATPFLPPVWKKKSWRNEKNNNWVKQLYTQLRQISLFVFFNYFFLVLRYIFSLIPILREYNTRLVQVVHKKMITSNKKIKEAKWNFDSRKILKEKKKRKEKRKTVQTKGRNKKNPHSTTCRTRDETRENLY